MSSKQTCRDITVEDARTSGSLIYNSHTRLGSWISLLRLPFDMLSFLSDWTGSFIDRWEGSHDGRLCNLSFVSPAPRGRKLARKNKGRKEPLLRTARRRERLPLFVPFSTSSSLTSSPPLSLPPALSLSVVPLVYRDEPATARRRRHRQCKRMKNE